LKGEGDLPLLSLVVVGDRMRVIVGSMEEVRFVTFDFWEMRKNDLLSMI